MSENEMTSIQITKDCRKKLKFISLASDRKMYELIDECIPFMHSRYYDKIKEVNKSVDEPEVP